MCPCLHGLWGAMQKCIQAWAVKYKSYSDYVQKGRTSAALEPKHGHEVSETMMEKFLAPSLDMSKLDFSSVFCKTTWLAGYAPEMRFCGVRANGAQTLKAGCLGDVLHVCVRTSNLVSAMKTAGLMAEGKQASMDAFCSILEIIDMTKMMQLFKGGLELYIHRHRAGELISLPMGWFTVEMSMESLPIEAIPDSN